MDDHGLKAFFLRWPVEMPRRGILVTPQGEQIPFAGFLTSDDLLLIERTTPDSLGGRTVVLPYGNIAAIKLTDPPKAKTFHSMGFSGSLPAK